MKIQNCSAVVEKKESAFPLTYEDIKRDEGVYEAEGREDCRLITVGYPDTVVLYYEASGMIPGLLDIAVGWSGYKFRRTDEKVCFEIRKG